MGFSKDVEEFDIPLDALMGGQSKFDPVSEILQTNLEDRRIVINDGIDDFLMERVTLWILEFNKADKFIPVDKRKKIYLYINSGGGDVVEGRMLLSAIECSKTPVVTVGFAKCASMASYILAAGHERICFPNTVVLIHDGLAGGYASGNKFKDLQKFYEKLDEQTREFMIKHTKMTDEFLESIKDREYYLFSEESKSRGLIDKIIGIDIDLEEIL